MKRFYSDATTERAGGGWRVLLDGRAVKTQGGAQQIAPNSAVADALAQEWRAQGEKIDPASFPYRDMTDYAIDQVQPDRADTIAKLLAFAETDTLCYRADPEDALYRRQHEIWEPLVTAFETREGVTLPRVSGVIHRAPSQDTLAQLQRRLNDVNDFTLAALRPLASRSASLCIALTALEPGADVNALWDAASLEEEWQANLWGRDEEAEEQRVKKRGEFAAAARYAALVRAI